MAKSKKVIISCAITGAVHTPSMSPYLPVTPDAIVANALGAAAAGAAIIHLHGRDPETGRPDGSPECFSRFLPRIKQGCDAVINVSTGGGHGMTLDQRIAGALWARPEMSSLNMGSMNFGLFEMLGRNREWKHEWEPAYLEMTRDFIFRNTFKDIEGVLERIGRGCGTRFEFECYDVGHLYSLRYFLDAGLVEPPLFVQTIFGIRGGIGADPEDLMHMKRTADRLFGEDYVWSVLAAGRSQMTLGTMGAILGANVRVGLEDSLYIGRGELAVDNAQQVGRIRLILENLGLDLASPDEARAMLGLKGGDAVGF